MSYGLFSQVKSATATTTIYLYSIYTDGMAYDNININSNLGRKCKIKRYYPKETKTSYWEPERIPTEISQVEEDDHEVIFYL